MNLVEIDGQRSVVSLEADELRLILGCINETLEAVEDWELPIRLGAEPSQIQQLQAQFKTLYGSIPKA